LSAIPYFVERNTSGVRTQPRISGMRLHLFEFEDFPWFPSIIRDGGTDYLRLLFRLLRFYQPVIPVLIDLMEKSGKPEILDLCSGGGGPVGYIADRMPHELRVSFTLSDKFPNVESFAALKEHSDGAIDYMAAPVDVLDVPEDIPGIRTLFSAIHHFRPEGVKKILSDCIRSAKPIAIFDGGDKHIGAILGILLLHPVLFLFCTPFMKPFRWSRILFTYLIPLIPLYTLWDGVISILRMYRPRELQTIAREADPEALYSWQCGKLTNPLGIKVTYLTGLPHQSN
jgi:hypothetical protein